MTLEIFNVNSEYDSELESPHIYPKRKEGEPVTYVQYLKNNENFLIQNINKLNNYFKNIKEETEHIEVISKSGKLYLAEKQKGEFQHTSFLAGKGVIGYFVVKKDSKEKDKVRIISHSGHYRSLGNKEEKDKQKRINIQQIVDVLRNVYKADLDNINLQLDTNKPLEVIPATVFYEQIKEAEHITTTRESLEQKQEELFSNIAESLKAQLAEKRKKTQNPNAKLVIAITGQSGIGKSVLLKMLQEKIGNNTDVLPVDWFLKDRETRKKELEPKYGNGFRGVCNGEELRLAEFHECFKKAVNSEFFSIEKYSREGENAGKLTKAETVSLTNDFLIVEGIHSISPETREIVDFAIYLDSKDPKLSRNARLERDLGERQGNAEQINATSDVAEKMRDAILYQVIKQMCNIILTTMLYKHKQNGACLHYSKELDSYEKLNKKNEDGLPDKFRFWELEK